MNKRILVAIIAMIIIICAGAFAFTNMQSGNGASIDVDANALQDKGNLVVDGEETSQDNGLFSSSSSDENAVLVKNGGVLKLANSLINKTGDTASTGDDADFYGINSAILVNTNGSLDISNTKIFTNSKGSNGIFVTNAESSGSSSSGNVALDGNGLAESSSSGEHLLRCLLVMVLVLMVVLLLRCLLVMVLVVVLLVKHQMPMVEIQHLPIRTV